MKHFLYGSMNKKHKSKTHIINDDGIVLCGAKGYWIEISLQQINDKLQVEGHEHLPSLYECEYACKKCVAKFKSINQ